jgi:protein farnesyltransferase/geranylgeranyltransferase type-1 subunit alpha
MSGDKDLPYSEDPVWRDVEPEEVTCDQGKVIAIQYTEEHKEAIAYFRAVLAKVRH